MSAIRPPSKPRIIENGPVIIVRLEGIEAVHPVTGKHIPIFVSDYVLMGYGTGIVMGVPGHDQRDWDFATAFGLPIVEVVKGGDVTKCAFALKDDTGIMVNSDFLNGLTVKEAIPTMKKTTCSRKLGTVPRFRLWNP